MGFFTNRSINLINFHSAFIQIANSLFQSFGPIFLYQQGLSISLICSFYAFFSVLRILFRVIQVPLIKKMGVKNSAIFGALGLGASYLFLPYVDSINIWLWIYTVLGAFFSAMYWMGYHYFFCICGENKNRGKSLSAHAIIKEAVQILTPLISAMIITEMSFVSYSVFVFITILIAISFLFFISGNFCIKDIIPFKRALKEEDKFCLKFSLSESSSEYTYLFIWNIVLFITLGELLSFGAVISLGILINMIFQIFIGKFVDTGKGLKVLIYSFWGRLMTLLGKVFLGYRALPIVALEGSERIAHNSYKTAAFTAYYNTMKNSKNPYWHLVFAETGWDLGAIIGLLGMASLIEVGLSARFALLITIIPMFLYWRIAKSYYKKP